MTITKKTILLTVFGFLAFSLSAQINLSAKPKDLLKDKKENATNQAKSKAETAQPAPSAPVSGPAASPERTPGGPLDQPKTSSAPARGSRQAAMDDKYKPSSVELDFDSQPFQPAIAWASLLTENCWYFNCATGEMKLTGMEVSFLPEKTKSGEAVRYESYANKTPLLRMEVWDVKNNKLVQTMHYSAKPGTAPFYDMEVLEGFDYKSYAKLIEGSYELRFWAGTRQFYTFPFSVEKQSNPDPYAPVHDFYFRRGPWQDWGRVEFGPEGHFIFNFYLDHETTTNIPNQARWDVKKDYKFLVKLYRDGKMVAVHSLQNVENKFEEGDLQSFNGTWKKYDCTLHAYPPASKGTGGGSRAFFMKSDMKDGNYTVEVLLKPLEGGEQTLKYGFTVKDGAIVPDPKADRTKNTDPLQFLEQGRDRFYVRAIH